MKVSDFIAKTVQSIDAGLAELNKDRPAKDVYVNETEGPSNNQTGISFEIPVSISDDGEPSVFPFDSSADYADAPVPRVAFNIRKRNG